MNKFPKLIALFLLFCGFACQQEPQLSDSLAYESLEEQMEPPMDQSDRQQDEREQEPDEPADVEQKLIKEGDIRFETVSIDSTRKQVLAAVKRNKGYISSDNSESYAGQVSHTLVIRVPKENFDALVKEITQGVDRLDRKAIQVKDVTAEFVDMSARLKTKKELENRYTALLQQARNVSEMLEIERQIGQLRGEIESIEGRLKYLQNKVSLSTLTVSFYETIPTQVAFGKKFVEGFRQGWENLIWFLVGLVNIWPFLLLIPVVIWGFRRLRRR
ncbi:MAG: DUF4349 domain-containing protein [Bacteroidota bacterium]